MALIDTWWSAWALREAPLQGARIGLQRFAEVLIICEGSFQLSAISKYKKADC